MNSKKNNCEPIFVLCLPRTGSTLLERIMDTHPAIFCCGEIHLGILMKQLASTLRNVYAIPYSEIYTVEIEKVAQYVESIMKLKSNKPIWCDRSTTTLENLPVILKVFPKARYVVLFRHCMDFIHSLLEVTKYNLGKGYGVYECFINNPNNIVDGLVSFWCNKAETMITLNKKYGINPHYIRYIDIITDTNNTLKGLYDFLELPFNDKDLEKINFKKVAPGDSKIRSTDKIIEGNVGKGKSVPMELITPNNLKRMNSILETLGYEVDSTYYKETWGGYLKIKNLSGVNFKWLNF